MDPASARWATVYTGPVWRAMAMQSLLDEAGFLTQVPDSNTRAIDPFITGGDAFSLSVLVPENDGTAAVSLVQSHEVSHEPSASPRRDPGTGQLAHTMRWLTTLMVTAPIAFVLGLVYLHRVRRADVRPADHGFNVLTLSAAGLLSAVAIFTFVEIWLDGR